MPPSTDRSYQPGDKVLVRREKVIENRIGEWTGPTSQPIHTTEIIEPSDPRAKSPEMQQAVMNEVRDLLQRRTFKVLLREELPDGA